MSSLVGSSSTGTDPRARIRVTARLANRFYEPIVLLDALNATCNKKPSTAPDLSSDLTRSPQHLFHCFVNKLAQLCGNDRGGETVTAFTMLQYPDYIEYRFTSNQRETDDFVHAKDFTTTILQILGNMEGHEEECVISSILRTSLSFSRPRLKVYVSMLGSRAVTCISACETENTDESRSILEKLKELDERRRVFNEELKDDEFVKRCESLIKSIDQLHRSEVYGLIYNRAKEGKMDESESWSELRHTAGRLLSYLQAAKFLVSMSKRWPELFDNPRVCYVTSSVPDACPFRGRHSPNKMTANGIIGRMTSDVTKIQEYRAYAQELERVGLDQRLQVQARKLRPIVHAEVLLLESLKNDGGTRPTRFFNGYKYIGCSKPTCRLCCHYFSVHPSGVEVRQTHRNLYPSWRMPDVYEYQGPQAEKDMIKLMDKVLHLIRMDAFRVLTEKLAEGKRYDSNTETSYPRGSASVRSLTNVEDLTLSLRNFEVSSSDNEEAMSSIPETGSVDEGEESADESGEDGGVKILWRASYAAV